MNNCHYRIAAALFLFALASCSSAQPSRALTSNEKAPQGFTDVPPADPSVVRWNRPLEEWNKPILVVRTDGVELISKPRSSGTTISSVDEMSSILYSLPKKAWPLGCIVGVQERRIRSLGDDERIDANTSALKTMLRTLGIQIIGWPIG